MPLVARLLVVAALLFGAAPSCLAQGAQSGIRADSGARCWPELRTAEAEKPGGAIGKMIRLRPGISPSVRFEKGESLVVVLTLPSYKKPYMLEFQATPDVNIGKPGEILWPSVVLTDADFCATAILPELDFKSKYSFLTSQTTTRASVTIADPAPRYALVYSDPTKVGQPIGLKINGANWGDLRRSEQGYVMVRVDR